MKFSNVTKCGQSFLNVPKSGVSADLVTVIKEILKRPSTLLKNRPWHRCFSVNFTKFYYILLGDYFFMEHLQTVGYGTSLFFVPSRWSKPCWKSTVMNQQKLLNISKTDIYILPCIIRKQYYNNVDISQLICSGSQLKIFEWVSF